jgi:hypothetical protein
VWFLRRRRFTVGAVFNVTVEASPAQACHHDVGLGLVPAEDDVKVAGKRSRTEKDGCILPTLRLRKGGLQPIRRPPAANIAGQEVRNDGTHFSASEGQHFGENDQEESWREFLYSFQPFTQPRLTEVGHLLPADPRRVSS